ncbi:MAG: hypothetical protein ACYDBB_17770 [Armatimonadota bacterium]
MRKDDLQGRYGVTISREELGALCERVKTTLLSHRRTKAGELAAMLADEPYPLSLLFLEVIAPVLNEITDEWHRGQRPFAEIASAWSLAEFLLPILSERRLADVPLDKPPVLVTNVEGNYHAFGTRMLADLLWEAHYPATFLAPPAMRAEIVQHCLTKHPACVALAVSLTSQFDELLATADTLRRDGYNAFIAAGGSALAQHQPDDWRNHGIDWLGADPLAFIGWLDQQIGTMGAEREAA